MTGVVWNLLQVQVIPWVISDSNFVRCPAQRLDPSKTVFVGALHGMLNAEALASIMNDLFGGVMYAGIDTDKHKYPIGEEGRGGATALYFDLFLLYVLYFFIKWVSCRTIFY